MMSLLHGNKLLENIIFFNYHLFILVLVYLILQLFILLVLFSFDQFIILNLTPNYIYIQCVPYIIIAQPISY